MTPNFAAGLDFASGRDRPMKEGIESRDADSGLRRFHVFEKCREAPNDLSRAQIFGHAVKFLQTHARFLGPRRPWIRTNFFWRELAFQREQNIPFAIAKIDNFHANHFRGLVCFLPGRNYFPANMPDAKRENASRRHDPELFRADSLG